MESQPQLLQPGRPLSFILYFLEARDELTPESRQILDRVVDELSRRPAPEIVVIGHTDRVGPVPYNDTLSVPRAERVRDELIKVGIAAERIGGEGRGPTDRSEAIRRRKRRPRPHRQTTPIWGSVYQRDRAGG